MNRPHYPRGKKRALKFERLSDRQLLAGDLTNPGNPLDVNDDLNITAIDALQVINSIGKFDSLGNGSAEPEAGTERYADVSGDNAVTAIDALRIINALGRQGTQVTFRLVNDTDREQAGTRDERTYDLQLEGKVNFGPDEKTLFVGVQQAGELAWIDLTPYVGSNGYFQLSDRQVRGLLTDVVGPGRFELLFSPDGSTLGQQDIEIELLVAPPRSELTAAAIEEDTVLMLDITAAIYDPDSDPSTFAIAILDEPESGTLSIESGMYFYQPDENFFGVDTIVYQVSDESETSDPVTLSIDVTAINDAPTIDPIDDQSVELDDRSIQLPLSAFDIENSALHYVGYATVPNHLHEIRSTYGLTYGSDEIFDLVGLDEKWFFGDSGTSFFLLPTGELIQWLGEDPDAPTTEQMIAQLTAEIYDDPLLLGLATEEILAPATVSVTEDSVIVIPDDGLSGTITVNVGVVDSVDGAVSRFDVELLAPTPEKQEQLDRVEALINDAAVLTMENTPAFLQSIAADLDTFSPELRAQLTNLLSQLLFDYEQNIKLQIASEDWLVDTQFETERELAAVQWVEQQLSVLKTNYETALETYGDSLLASNPANSAPPIFTHGTDYSVPIQTHVGESVQLDFRALHPDEVGFFYSLQGYDPQRHGNVSSSSQTGVFLWHEIPKEAIGTNIFTILAERPGGESDASVTFTIEVAAAEPAVLDLLTVSPSALTDSGSDEVTLTARDAWHPQSSIYRVWFYQDSNGDNAYTQGIDRRLGLDTDGSDGWNWTGTPLPSVGSNSLTFFAIADPNQGSDSSPISVAADVISVPQLQASVLAQDGGEVERDGVSASARKLMVRYDNGDSAVGSVIHSGDDAGMYITRYSDSGEDGIGTAKGDPLRVTPAAPSRFEVRGDSDGNLAVFASYSAFSAIDPNATSASIWMFRIDQNDQLIGDPVRLTGESNEDYAFTSAMNETGQGFIAWAIAYASQPIYIQTFTQAGDDLHAVQQIDLDARLFGNTEWNSSAINELGDFVIAWENEAAIGNVEEPDSTKVVLHETSPWLADINDDGWIVLANQSMQILDPAGRLVGEPEQALTGASSGSISFEDDETIVREYLRRDNPGEPNTYRSQNYRLLVQPDLLATAEIISSTHSVPNAGDQIDVRVQLENSATSPSDPTTIAYFLSHDDVIDSRDRLLGSVAVDVSIAGGESLSVDHSVALPLQADPFWQRGATELNLIAQVIGGKTPGVAALPIVKLDFAQLLSARIDELAAIQAIDASERTTTAPKVYGIDGYIDPLIVQQQLFGGTSNSDQVAESINMFQLLGYQYLSGLRAIAQHAPYDMREDIIALGRDVSGTIDRFEFDQFNADQWEQQQIELAAAARTKKIATATTARDDRLRGDAAAGNALLALNRIKIDEVENSKQERESAKLSEWNKDLTEAQHRLDSLSDSEANLLQINHELNSDDGFALSFGSVVRFVTDNAVQARDSLVSGAREFFDDLSEHYQGIYLETKGRLDGAIAGLNDQISRVSSIVDAEIGRAVAGIKKQNERLVSGYNEAVRDAQDIWDRLEAGAQAVYEDAINVKIPAGKEAIKQFVPSAAAPALRQGLDTVNDRLSDLNSPDGILQTLQNDLQSLGTTNPLGSIQEIASTLEDSAIHAGDVLTDIKKQLAPAVNATKEAGGEFSDWAKDTGGDVSQFVKDNLQIFNEEIVAYKIETGFDLTLNLGTGSLFVDANIAPGIDYDSGKLFDLLEGKIAFPDLDPIETVANLIGVELDVTNNYDEIRGNQYDEFGATNVYFASERFVEYFGGETVLADATEIVASGGGSAKTAMQDLANQLRLEVNDVFSWLTLKGQEQFESIAPSLLKALITQAPFESPHLELKWTPVTYNYELDFSEPSGNLSSLNPLQSLAADELLKSDYVESLVDDLQLDTDLPHAAFTLVWKIPTGIEPPTTQEMDLEIDANLQDFDFGSFSGTSISSQLIDLAMKELQSQGLPDIAIDILGELANVIVGFKEIEAVVSGEISDLLGFDAAFIQNEFDEFRLGDFNGFELDLRGTTPGIQLAGFFDQLTFGNIGTASLDELTFDLTTFTLKVSGTLCHKHSWGTLAGSIGL